MNPRGRLNLVMGLLAATALAFGIWRWRQQVDDAAISSTQLANRLTQAQLAKRQMGTPEGRAQQVNPSMPVWGRPLGAEFDALRQRADAGDAQAACRIGMELSLCAMSQRARSSTQTSASNVSTADLAKYCEGIDSALLTQAATYLRKAAQAGNRDAMLRYAQGPFFNAAGTSPGQYRYLQDPVFADWYQEALPTLQRALQAGDPRAAQLLANAYADDSGPLDALVPNDPVQVYAYRLLLSYLHKQSPPDAAALEPRQRADAEQKAQRLYREAFGSQPIADGVPDKVELQPGSSGPPPCQ